MGDGGFVVATLAAAVLVALAMMAPAAAAAPTPVSSCQTIASPGTYALTADLSSVDATCIEITSSDVKLDLAGHTIACTGSGFAGSCQVPQSASRGVDVAAGLSGTKVTGPGTITGFDNGIEIEGGDAHVKGVTITGPPCDPSTCERPVSNGIVVLGGIVDGFPQTGPVGVNLSRNDVSNHARGALLVAQCPGGDAGCVLNGNTVHDIGGAVCTGINLSETTGYTLTRNVLFSNGSPCSVGGRGGIVVSDGSTGNELVNNDSSNNFSFGISIGPGTNGNTVVKNVARGNTVADLRGFPGTSNTWNDNNRCNTESGAVPASVCNPGE